jgi:sigma-B regulation protein RsbU (phosphoserine phosphatase)
MNLPPLPLPKLNVRTKILILFLALSVISLGITGYVALVTLGDLSRSAETSCMDMGQKTLDNATTALQVSAEEHLIQAASDQAQITNVLFEDTETEMELLAAQATTLQGNPPVQPIIHSYNQNTRPQDPSKVTMYYLSPGITLPADSTEFRRVAGMDDLLKATFDTDGDLTAVYIATDSGILRKYPWESLKQDNFDPRQREWFTGALNTTGVFWSKPYIDASGHGLVVTASKAVATPEGAWVIGSDVTDDIINSAFLSQTTHGKGYTVLMDSNGTIISRTGYSSDTISPDKPFSPGNVFDSGDPALIAVGKNMTSGKTGVEKLRFGNQESFVAYAPVKSLNWSFAVSMPVDAVTEPVDRARDVIAAQSRATADQINWQTEKIMIIFSVLFAILLIVVIFLAVYLSRIITRPVDALKDAALALGRGDLEYRITLSTGDEFEELAHSFNTMAADLRRNIDDLQRTTADKERYTKELEIAKEIQDTFLPEKTPVIPGFAISATTIPAMEIGGDLYDFIPVPGNRWGFVIADVSGKGVSAALYMALCRTLLHASGEEQGSPSAAVRRANRLIYEDGRSTMFITVFYAVLDPQRMTITYVNAGHNPPVLVRGNPPVAQMVEGKGIALGVIEDVDIPERTIPVEHGDLILLYTDGITEAFNEREEYFGEERMIASVCRNKSRPVQEILDALLVDIRQFAGSAPQSDDITIILIQVP